MYTHTHTHTHTQTQHAGTGRLMSGTPLDPGPMSFGISLSDNPYSGNVQVATVSNDNVWFYRCKSSTYIPGCGAVECNFGVLICQFIS